MQEQINLFELKQAWLSRLDLFKRKSEENYHFLQLKTEANIDLK